MKTLIRTARSHEDILAVKKLDDTIFSGFHGIELQELHAIQNNGAVLMLETPDGELIGESQILFSPILYLPYDFGEDVAFCYGTGITPEYQGCKLGGVLAQKQEDLAVMQKKQELHLTVRVENYPSLKMRMSLGFCIVSYIPFFYGPHQAEDARLLMVKKLEQKAPDYSGSASLHVPVDFSLPFNPLVHSQIASLCEKGFVGHDIDHTGIFFCKP